LKKYFLTEGWLMQDFFWEICCNICRIVLWFLYSA
jgi:hypothetical protein